MKRVAVFWKRLWQGIGLLAVIALGFLAVAIFLYQSNVQPPSPIQNWIKTSLKKKLGIEVGFSDLHIQVQGKRIVADDVVVGASGTSPAIKLGSLILELASGTSPRALFRGEGIIEKADVASVEVDLLGLDYLRRSLTLHSSGAGDLSGIPLNSFSASGVRILSPVGPLVVPVIRFDVKRVLGNADFFTLISENPLDGTASVSLTLSLNQPGIQSRIVWKDISLAKLLDVFGGFLPFSSPFNLVRSIVTLTGRVDLDLGWKGDPFKRIASPGRDLGALFREEVSGSVTVREGRLVCGADEQSFSFQVSRNEESTWTAALRVSPATGTLEIHGNWCPPLEAGLGSMTGHFFADKLQIPTTWAMLTGRLEPRLGLGFLNGSGTVSWDGRVLRTDGIASFAHWAWEGKDFPPAGLAWKQVRERVEASGTISFEHGSVSGLGALNMGGPEKGVFEATGDLTNVGMDFLQKLFKIPIAGVGNGGFTVTGRLDDLNNSDYDLHLHISQPHLFGIDAESLSGRLFGTGANWNVGDPIVVFKEKSFLKLEGNIASSGYSCRVLGEGLSPSHFGATSRQASGTFSLTGELTGKLTQPELEGEIWSRPLSIMGFFFDSFRSHLKVASGRLELHPLVVGIPGGGSADGFLSLDIRTGALQGFQMNVLNLDLSAPAFRQIAGFERLQPRGKLSGTIRHCPIEGESNARGLWDVSLQGTPLSVGSETFDHFRCEASGNQERFEIRNLRVSAFDGEIEFHGRGQFSPRIFSGEGAVRDVNLKRIQALKKAFPGCSGLISGEGSLDWSPAGRSGMMTVFGKGLSVKNQELGNLGCDLVVDDEGVKIRRAAVDNIGVEAVGEVKWGLRHPYRASLKLSGTDLSFVPSSFGLKGFLKGDLLVDGSCEIRGVLATSTPDFLKANITGMEIRRGGDIVVANRPVDLVFQNGRLEIRSFELKYRQGIFGVQGVWDPRGQCALTLNGRDFSLLALGSLAEIPGWNVDGSLSVKGGISGPVGDPKMAADILVKRLTVAGRMIPQVDARVKAGRQEIAVSPMVLSLTKNQVTFEGKLPFRDGWKMGDLDLKVRVPKGPLDDLPLLLPELFKTARGEMHGEMRFFGNPFQPSVSGDLEFSAEELAFPGMRKPLKNVVFGVKTENQTVRIEPLRAQLGRGTITGGGEIDFRGGPGSISLRLTGENLDVAWGRIDLEKNRVEVTATGDLYNPIVRGKILMPKGRIQLSDNLMEGMKFDQKLPFQSLDYRFDFEIPRNLWVRNSMLNAEMRGKFSVFGDLKTIHVTGGVQTVQGALYFQRRKFTIENGEVKFGEREGQLDPHVYFKSVTNIQNTQVYMTLEGRLSSLKPRLYSSPPLAEGDIFALITLGRSIDQHEFGGSRGQLERDILENLKNTYLTGLLSSTLGTALNLDELYMGSLFDRTLGISRSFLRIGKYLGHNIFFAYEGTLSNEDKKTYIFEYRLPRGFLFNVEVEKPTNEIRLGVKYDWRF
ncbi:MAG: translocation/assembly module TamB domain-containing protein [Candidatus Ozemobacteraceae bacterium]